MRFVCTTAALLLIASVSIFGQTYDDAITVNVVEVPVYVDRFGVPVTGLTRDDFELSVNGKPHPIDSFDVIEERTSDETRTEAALAPPELNRRRLVVLLFDISGSSVYPLHRARKFAMQFVEDSPSGDTYAVATIGRPGVRFVVPFTTDRVAVTRAIGTLAKSQAADPFHVATLGVERAVWGEATGGVTPRGWFPDASDVARALRQEADREEQFLEHWLFTDDLADLADQLAPLSGIKHVVLLSERREMADPLRGIEPAARVHERYRAAGVILDGIDIRLPRVPGGTASEARAPRERPDVMLSNFLYSLALDTGGAVDASLKGLQQRNRVAYVLGFQPPRTQKKTNSIRVRLKDRRLFTEVRHRQSYTLAAPESKDDWLFLADTLLNDIPQRGLTLDVDVRGTSVVAAIPGVELLSYPSDAPLLLDVYLYVFDEKDQPAAWKHVRVSVDLAGGREFLSDHPYTLRQDFDLPPGRYTAKAIVRVVGSGSTGFSREDFVAP